MLQGIQRTGIDAMFIWVQAYRGIEGNEMAARYAMSVIGKEQISMGVTYSKAD